MDFALARTNMIKSQVVPFRVLDPRVHEGMYLVAREAFVDPAFQEFAYSDAPLPQKGGQRLTLKPALVGRLVEALELTEGAKVLVVGAGSGYETALLAAMGMQVFALEEDTGLAQAGQENVSGDAVQWRVGPLEQGWAENSPFDAILVCGAVAAVSNKLIGQLGRSGRLVAVVGRPGDVVMRVMRMKGISGGDRPETLFDTMAPILMPPPENERFQL